MKTTEYSLSGTCGLVSIEYSEELKDVCLEYIEHSGDYWSTDTSIDITKEDAKNIIKFLQDAYNL